MCGLHTYDKLYDNSCNSISSMGRITLPEDSTFDYLVYLCVSLNFIDIWFNYLENNFAWIFCAYQDNIEELFKIPAEKPTLTLEDFKKTPTAFN